jgi:hypothetical protein
MVWTRLGKVWCPSGHLSWARHSFMTPVPIQLDADTIRVFGGTRDDCGISRISWIDVDRADPTRVLRVSDYPVMDVGQPGMFDDNGIILGDVLRMSDSHLRMYYVGFQLVEKAKFLAFTGLAESYDNGGSFERVKPTPILDRAPGAQFINALHSILPTENGYRAWIACGEGWEVIGGAVYPRYNCWTLESADGIHFDIETAVRCLDVSGDEYRIGRPRANRAGGGYELRVTSDTRSKLYSCHLATSTDGVAFTRTDIDELPRGQVGDWDAEMTCYPARIDTDAGESYLFYNGNGMGRTGVGVARWES